MNLYDVPIGKVKSASNANSITGLIPGKEYHLFVFASNTYGAVSIKKVKSGANVLASKCLCSSATGGIGIHCTVFHIIATATNVTLDVEYSGGTYTAMPFYLIEV